jgi:O-succinylbenzoic acid--CoA ligase
MDLYPVDVTGHPLAETSTAIDFAAMIPLQVYNSLSTKIERERLSQIKNIIVGGGALDKELENSLKDLPNSIYSTYGMTETLSHVALRRINGVMADKYYTALPGININLSAEQTLIIDAPFISNELIITNDIAEINSNGSFRILGRKDNVINTGGVKVLAEEVEEKLKPYIKHNYSITSIPNTKLGEEIVLLIEKSENYNNLEYIIEKEITLSYQQPKKIYRVKSIPLTSSGKIDRVAIKILAQQINLVNNI